MFKSEELIIFKRATYLTVAFILLTWTIKSVEWAGEIDLGNLGILPRTLKGSLGILTGPLIHGDLVHLMSNTFPLLILGIGLFYFYHRIALEVFIWIYLASGFWVWVIGREAYHIGASGIVYGLAMFIFWGGVWRRDTRSLAISMIIFFLYGYMIYGLFPGDAGVSWESHVMGSVAGIFLAFYFRKSPIYVGQDEKTHHEENDPTPSTPPKAAPDSGGTVHHTHDKPVHFIYTYQKGGKKKSEG